MCNAIMKKKIVFLSIIVMITLFYFGLSIFALADSSIPLEKQLVYSHKKHVERGYKCQVCHPGITESDDAQDRNFPKEETCRVCHDGVILDNSCTLCHQNLTDLKALPNPKRDILFSHKIHYAADPDCYRCHKGVDKTHYCLGEFLPEMPICMDCHDGHQAGRECEVCHAGVPRPNLRPKNHNELWLHAHRSESRDSRDQCSLCHEQTYCQDCHQGFNITAFVHDKDYLMQHGLDARLRITDCDACHDSEQFCQECHISQGAGKPMTHLLDPNWDQSGHAREAVNNIEPCAACHNGSASVCIDCHQEGSGLNPHSTGFISGQNKGPWHDDDGYMCYYCHLRQDDATVGFCGYCHF
ncbi:MAG: hypothetical protein B6244_13400 [Candidatus Cloacimonetes bacterium 4572_55]|nr:MAG: hypothetical protein B6244_13400 [Candidatus Cloacimonetes bacterium 4572_55]